MEKLGIAVASADDLLMLSDWAADEGWNPGQNDGIAFSCADPHGFLIGRVAGVPAVSVSVVQYGELPQVRLRQDLEQHQIHGYAGRRRPARQGGTG